MKEEFENVIYRVSEEGLDYTFMHYSSWEDVKDEVFHKLRKDYIDAAKAMSNYLGQMKEKYDIEDY